MPPSTLRQCHGEFRVYTSVHNVLYFFACRPVFGSAMSRSIYDFTGYVSIWCMFRFLSRYAVPFDDKDGRERIRNLFRKFRVTTLPHVVLLDESGRVINSQAYTSMLANPQGFPWKRQKVLQMLGDSVVNQKGETVKHVGFCIKLQTGIVRRSK